MMNEFVSAKSVCLVDSHAECNREWVSQAHGLLPAYFQTEEPEIRQEKGRAAFGGSISKRVFRLRVSIAPETISAWGRPERPFPTISFDIDPSMAHSDKPPITGGCPGYLKRPSLCGCKLNRRLFDGKHERGTIFRPGAPSVKVSPRVLRSTVVFGCGNVALP